MSARGETLLWLAQRITAGILAFAVIVHLATIIMAMEGGLSAREIIDRLRGNTAWLVLYIVFVVSVAVHAPIGLRTILREITPLKMSMIDGLMALLSVMLVWTGVQAILGLYGFSG